MIEIGPYQLDEINRSFRGFIRDTLIPAIFKSVNELEDYWPLTLRQLYYRLVAKLIINNHINRYKSLSRTVTKLRRLEILPWEVIEDKTRRVSDKRGYESAAKYSRGILQAFDKYNRCLVQNQENYVEIFIEKEALGGIFEEVAWPYCVKVVTLKGQSSATYLHDYSVRAHASERKPVILYFGDLDPTGARIPVSIMNTLAKYHNLEPDLWVVALQPKQVESYNLPYSIDALKKSDPNYEWFVRNFGYICVELDALHPKDLQALVRQELAYVLDIEDMLLQQQIQNKERDKFKAVKKQIEEIMRTSGIL